MKTLDRQLKGPGEVDYDFVNDILFFKVKDREYDESLELGNLVVDIDTEKFIVGIQIFDASEFLQVSKDSLRNIPRWKFQAFINKDNIEIRLNYQTQIRNTIVEKNPIIVKENKSNLPVSEVTCVV